MGKWLWLSSALVVAAGANVYWHANPARPLVQKVSQATVVLEEAKQHPVPCVPARESEACDTIEPLLVDGSPLPQAPVMEPATDEEPATRVVLAQGMRQPPRPDAEAGNVLRMPYADEEDVVGSSTNPVQELVESLLSRLSRTENADDGNAAEESEMKDLNPPMQKPEPEPNPATDYHRQYQHCPYSGAYANPYRRY